MKYIILEKVKLPNVVLEKAWRHHRRPLVARKVPVKPKTGRPYLAIRWTAGARTEELGGDVGRQLKALVGELTDRREKMYMKYYIRYLYGQRGKPAYPRPLMDPIENRVRPDIRDKHRLKDFERIARSIMVNLPRARHQEAGEPPDVRLDERADREAERMERERNLPPRAGTERTQIQRIGVDSNKIAEYLRKKIAQGQYTTWETAMARVKEVFPDQSDSRYERSLEKAGLRKPRPEGIKLEPNEWEAIRALPGGPHKEYFQVGALDEVEKLGGGINQTFRMKFKDNGEGCWKPSWGESPARAGFINRGFKGEYFRREAATYSIAKVLGLDDLVPETYVRNDPQEGVGSVMSWVWDGNVEGGGDRRNRYKKDEIRSGFLDFMCENMDRHGRNFFVTKGANYS